MKAQSAKVQDDRLGAELQGLFEGNTDEELHSVAEARWNV